jgi:Domain of unknown function (DUF4926)
MMETKNPPKNETPAPSQGDAVALLVDLPAVQLVRGQVGTIAEEIDDEIVMVEFSDQRGRSYSLASCRRDQLLTLHYAPVPAGELRYVGRMGEDEEE